MKKGQKRISVLLLAVITAFSAMLPLAAQAQAEKKQSVNFAMTSNPDTLDPHKTSGTPTFQTIRSFYDTLV